MSRDYQDRFLDRVEVTRRLRADSRFMLSMAGTQPHQASVTPARAIPMRYLNHDEPWQAKVRRYDREGPGFVGFALDLKALVAAMVPLHVQERDAQGEWQRTDSPAASEALNTFTGVGQNQSQLVYSQFRSLDAVGEYWLMPVDTPDGLRWVVAQTPQLDFLSNGNVTYRTRPDQPSNDQGITVLHRDQVSRCHHPDPEWSGEAYSALRRTIPDIERYRSTVRNINRTTDSRLLTNGLVWFAPDDPSKPSMPGPDTPIQSVEQVMADYIDIAWKALSDDSDFAAFAPFPVSGQSKPEYVEVGRSLDPEVLAAETAALEAVGRSLDFPQQLLVEGPGAGNHWSDLLLKDDFLQTAIAPKLEEVLGYMTTVALQPVLKVMGQRGADLDDPSRYRIWYDLTDVAKRPDTSEQMLTAWRDGVAGLEATGQALGLSEDQLLDLPDDVSEYDHWVQVNTKAAATPAKGSALPGAPNPALSPSMGASATGQVMPPKVGRASAPANLGARLSGIDRRLFARLMVGTEVAFSSAIDQSGRALMRMLPQGDLRTSLRDVPLDQVWFNVPADVRTELGFTEQDVLGDYPFGTLAGSAEQAYQDAQDEIDAELEAEGILPGPQVDKEAAVGFLLAGLGTVAVSRLNQPNPVQRGEQSAFTRVPPIVVRDSMRVSAGATFTGGALVRDPDGKPQLANGRWIGSDGPASGPLTLDYLVEQGVLPDPSAAPVLGPDGEPVPGPDGDPGNAVDYTWVWGDASRPFEPHFQLNGEQYTNETRDEVLANPDSFPDSPIYYPGDHEGCTCWEDITLNITLGSPTANDTGEPA